MDTNQLQELVDDLKAANAALLKAEKALDSFVRPIVLEYLNVGNYDEARRLAARCGDSLTQVFLLDTIREHKINNVGR